MTQFDVSVTKLRTVAVAQLILNTLAMLAFAFSALTNYRWIGYSLGGLVLLAVGYLFVRFGPGGYIAVQLLVLGGFLVNFDGQQHSHVADELLIVTAVVIMTMLLNEETFKRITTRMAPMVANLPGGDLSAAPLVPPEALSVTSTVLVAVVGLSAALSAPAWPVAVLTMLEAALSLTIMGQMVLGRRRLGHAAATIRKALEHHQPEFALYFSAPGDTDYHVAMWLPYLERVGRPFMIILREPASLLSISQMASCPVLSCPSVTDVDNVAVPSLRAVFYVNNGAKNAHMVRFNQMTHIQLLHGDSDKASSYNPVTAMFGKVYVAGQAAIDRYATNNVYIAPEKFEIVGRPQVADVAVATGSIRATKTKTVLYATTWSGLYTDANYCSLGLGKRIVEELLRRDVTVILRPHPYTNRSPETRALAADLVERLAADRAKTGRKHLFGATAEKDMSLFDCFNKADALISDVSGVASDFLYSQKPLALTDMVGDGPRFTETFPLAKAAYVLRSDLSNLAEVLDNLLDLDPIESTRRSMKEYYLGDFPAESYGEVFVEAARRELKLTDRASVYH